MKKTTNEKGPLYRQIYKDLLNKIMEKEYTEGDILPSEKEMQDIYRVSRITIRRAMGMLQQNGYIQKSSGMGTVVTSTKNILGLENISSFSEEDLGRDSKSKLLNFEIIKAPTQALFNLKLKSNSDVYLIERLRYLDDEVVGYHKVYVPTSHISLSKHDFSSPTVSLYDLFEANGVVLDSADETIEAIISDEKTQELLKVGKNSALLYINRTVFDKNNTKPIEYVEMYYRADKFKYKTKLKKR